MLRCEDFIAEPQRTIRRMLDLAWEEATPLPHAAEHEVKMGSEPQHMGELERLPDRDGGDTPGTEGELLI